MEGGVNPQIHQKLIEWITNEEGEEMDWYEAAIGKITNEAITSRPAMDLRDILMLVDSQTVTYNITHAYYLSQWIMHGENLLSRAALGLLEFLFKYTATGYEDYTVRLVTGKINLILRESQNFDSKVLKRGLIIMHGMVKECADRCLLVRWIGHDLIRPAILRHPDAGVGQLANILAIGAQDAIGTYPATEFSSYLYQFDDFRTRAQRDYSTVASLDCAMPKPDMVDCRRNMLMLKYEDVLKAMGNQDFSRVIVTARDILKVHDLGVPDFTSFVSLIGFLISVMTCHNSVGTGTALDLATPKRNVLAFEQSYEQIIAKYCALSQLDKFWKNAAGFVSVWSFVELVMYNWICGSKNNQETQRMLDDLFYDQMNDCLSRMGVQMNSLVYRNCEVAPRNKGINISDYGAIFLNNSFDKVYLSDEHLNEYYFPIDYIQHDVDDVERGSQAIASGVGKICLTINGNKFLDVQKRNYVQRLFLVAEDDLCDVPLKFLFKISEVVGGMHCNPNLYVDDILKLAILIMTGIKACGSVIILPED